MDGQINVQMFLANYTMEDMEDKIADIKYLFAGFENWCKDNKIDNLNTFDGWKDIFVYDYVGKPKKVVREKVVKETISSPKPIKGGKE